ncbi:MAG: alpha/beta fold hydrolase [Candidatus Helarchaeota archaeon]
MRPRKVPPDIEFKYKNIKIGDYNLKYWDEGPRDKLILYFLHGYTGDIQGWYFQISEFSKKYRVIAHNHRCHGNSDSKDEPVTIRDLSEDFNKVLDKLGIQEKIIVIGHSMGGFIAQQFTLDHQDRVKAMVLTDTSPYLPIHEDAFKQVQNMGIANLSKMLTKMFGIPLRKRPKELREYYKNLDEWEHKRKEHLPIYVAVNFLRAINEWNVVDRLSEIKVPTLIVFGEKDTMTDREKYSKLLHESIPNSKLIFVKDAGHGPPTEQVDEFNKILAEFVKQFE